jgi:outer membrane protein OmpA-like peptidoglycan-associated protein
VRDRDGAAQVEDICPPPDDDGITRDGCPGPEVKLVGDRVVIDDVIHFEFNSPRIRRKSTGLVRKVARFILENPQIEELSIEGHADARGTEAYNLRLSEERAESTRAMLTYFGVPDSRLHVIGYGKSKPLVATPLPEERNRRVEFIVVRTRQPVGPPPASNAGSGGGS